jgi:hypothetical protein
MTQWHESGGGHDVTRSPEDVGLGRGLLRHWFLTLVLVVLGALGGAAVARSQPPTYTAEARLAVGGGDLAAQAVPGFALASQELASNYARFVTVGPVRSALPPETAQRVLTVAASPVPESNVIRIEATATDGASATAAADLAGRRLVTQVNKIATEGSADQVRQQYRQLSQEVADAQQAQVDAQDLVDRYRGEAQSKQAAVAAAARRALPAARAALTRASVRLADLQLQQTALGALYQTQVGRGPSENKLSVVSAAAVSGDDRRSRLELYGLGGVAAGGVLALVLVAVLERRRRPAARRAMREDLGSGQDQDDPPGEALLRSRNGSSADAGGRAPGWAGNGDHAAAPGGDAPDRWDVADAEGRAAWTARR